VCRSAEDAQAALRLIECDLGLRAMRLSLTAQPL
jgi:hypothetical protein